MTRTARERRILVPILNQIQSVFNRGCYWVRRKEPARAWITALPPLEHFSARCTPKARYSSCVFLKKTQSCTSMQGLHLKEKCRYFLNARSNDAVPKAGWMPEPSFQLAPVASRRAFFSQDSFPGLAKRVLTGKLQFRTSRRSRRQTGM